MVTTDDADWVKSKRVFDGMTLSQGHSPAEDMSINAACRCPAPVLDAVPALTSSCRMQAHDHQCGNLWVVGRIFEGTGGFRHLLDDPV